MNGNHTNVKFSAVTFSALQYLVLTGSWFKHGMAKSKDQCNLFSTVSKAKLDRAFGINSGFPFVSVHGYLVWLSLLTRMMLFNWSLAMNIDECWSFTDGLCDLIIDKI